VVADDEGPPGVVLHEVLLFGEGPDLVLLILVEDPPPPRVDDRGGDDPFAIGPPEFHELVEGELLLAQVELDGDQDAALGALVRPQRPVG
jgi:hypothetical protein